MLNKYKFNTSVGVSSSGKDIDFFDFKKGVSIYLKIMLNYLQLISIIQNIDLRWPFYAKTYFDVYKNMGGVSTQTVSLECILNDLDYNMESLYVETIFSISLPFLTFFFALIFIILVQMLNNHKKQHILRRLIVVLIVSSIFLQPNIINMLYKNMVCKKIDSEYFLSSKMTIKCYSDDRTNW